MLRTDAAIIYKNWYTKDVTNFEENTLKNVKSSFGLLQLISEPAHILSNFFMH